MSPKINRPPNSRIERSAIDEVTEIQALLSDVYRDAGDGRTLVREIVQNADDAKAKRLVFAVVQEGSSCAHNKLLSGPALLVANNGPFYDKDWDSLRKAIGGSKTADTEKIGRFGIGLKSVFHLCEAFVYLGAESTETNWTLKTGVLNPWAGTGEDNVDPLHPDWDNVYDHDLRLLSDTASALLESFDNGLLLWIPLRLPKHCDRAPSRGEYGLGQNYPGIEAIEAWFPQPPASLALLLSQCGHLHSIEAVSASNPYALRELDKCSRLIRVARPNFKSGAWVGRYESDARLPNCHFEGSIEDGGEDWSVIGIDALGLESLSRLTSDPKWPHDQVSDGVHVSKVPRKALAHAAITVLHRRNGGLAGMRIRWAVFLPLDDAPQPNDDSRVVDTDTDATGSDSWDIIIHGYFWPSRDRRSIPGATDNDKGGPETEMRALWNRTLRDELLLPLLPRALARATKPVSEDVAMRLVQGVSDSRTVRDHCAAITRSHALLPVITATGIQWQAVGVDTHVYAVPAWKSTPESAREKFVSEIRTIGGVIFIADDAPRVGGEPESWPVDHIRRLLSCVSRDALYTSEGVDWTAKFVHNVLAEHRANEDCSRAVACWLADRVGEGALAAATDGAIGTPPEPLRCAWRRLFAKLPELWLVDAPVESWTAVTEIAEAGIMGPGFLPIPLGNRTEADPPAPSSPPDQSLLDDALRVIGKRLENQDHNTQHQYRSRLLLAEALLSVRNDDRPLEGSLDCLPLLRALRLPDDQDEARSFIDLCQMTNRHRVFARNGDDSKQAVRDLSEALGESVWLLNRVPASLANVPAATTDALAHAVVTAPAIRSLPRQRIPLLPRLAENSNECAGHALRTLLTGEPVAAREANDCDLYYVQKDDPERDDNRATLGILLRLSGKEWREVEPDLVGPLSTDVLKRLRVRAVDTAGVLQDLLGETLLTADADWLRLSEEEVLHLLKCLHGTKEEDRRRWRAMPLHRDVHGHRGCIDDRTLVANERGLPPELEAENIRLLRPDPQVEDLYGDVPPLGRDGVLRTMLQSKHSHRFANYILDELSEEVQGEHRVTLPDNAELLNLLKEKPWLPVCDHGSGIAPARVIDLPGELLSIVRPLGEALGRYRLPDTVCCETWPIAKDVVHEILQRPNRRQQVQLFAAALDTNTVADVDGSAYVILPCRDDVNGALIEDALETPLAGSHPGWGIVRAAKGQTTVDGVIVDVARALCAPVPAQRQREALAAIAADQPARDTPAGRLYQRLLQSFAKTDDFFKLVLPYIKVPTQDGNWHSTDDVARSPFGVALRHRILKELRPIFRLDTDAPKTAAASEELRIPPGSTRSDSVLCPYFKQWDGRLNNSAVGAFLSLLGDGRDGTILQLAQRWLGDDFDVTYVRRGLSPSDQDHCWANVHVFVSGSTAEEKVCAVNLLGQWSRMDPGDNDTIFATEPRLEHSRRGDYWIVQLRSVKPEHRNQNDLVSLLYNTVEWWAVYALKLERAAVQEWWNRWGTSSQAQVDPVRASILAHLPLTLQQLDVHDCAPLQEALTNAERAQRRREQADATTETQALATERKRLQDLGKMISQPAHSAFLRRRVRESMERSGYAAESVLLELMQNADDALAQAAEIDGEPLPRDARRVVIQVHEVDGMQTVDFRHFGRPINDTGGASFLAGRDRQWDQDLYFMMLLNLSAKPGEMPVAGAESSTTGRFGLGFKSVHLVSDSPSVVSGFLAFAITAGLLPEDKTVPNDPDLEPVGGQRATRIRLPLRRGVDTHALFRRFHPIRSLLPAFARELCEVKVVGGPYAGVGTFDGAPIDQAPGWSVSGATELPGPGTWRLLRFRPGAGTAALVVGLRDGVPDPLPPDVPFLWNVTPTEESWGCGYAVNGPFKLDPGRTHVSLDHGDTLRVVCQLGAELGRGLVELQAALPNTDQTHGLPVGSAKEVAHFAAKLWRVLASGIDNLDNLDKLRRGFLLQLHGPGRGLSAWMNACSVVPTELRTPFRELLPPLNPDASIERAEGGLEDAGLCEAMAGIDDLARLARGRLAVSGTVAHVLKSLGTRWSRLQPSDLFQELAEQWNYRLTPERLHTLRPLAPETVWKLIEDLPKWHSQFVARSAAGTEVPLRNLLLPRDLGDSSVEDELRRTELAPTPAVLDAQYICAPEDVTMFLRLRIRHNVDSGKIAVWLADPDFESDRRLSALRYLLHGDLRDELLQRLVPSNRRPSWLAEYDDVRRMLDDLNEDSWWRCNSLLAALFGSRFTEPEGGSGSVGPRASSDFFEQFQRWWDDETVRRQVIETYEKAAWPEWLRKTGVADGLGEGSPDHWLALFVLGACQAFGRRRDEQHRRFLEFLHERRYWEVFKGPGLDADNAKSWMEVLRTHQDQATDRLEWSRWMSLFPIIYQCSRYLDTYRRLLLTAGRRPPESYDITRLLAPRADPGLTGAGQHFDAPPAPLDMGRHWILRELVRLGIIRGDHLLPDCWVPSEQVIQFLSRFGLGDEAHSLNNADKARAVFDFLADRLETPSPHLHYALDIPLRHVAGNPEVRRRLGLET